MRLCLSKKSGAEARFNAIPKLPQVSLCHARRSGEAEELCLNEGS